MFQSKEGKRIMNLDKIISELTLEEKATLLTGAGSMSTADIRRLQIPVKTFADGPHGVRMSGTDDCIMFPSLSTACATWDKSLMYTMGEALADDCMAHGVDAILGPGANIKRTPVCGRNFEYFSEDPVLTGEMAAAYINGVQSKGVGTCLKHYAMNNQERDRLETSVEVNLRVMREIYLRGFEIAVKKSAPHSIMCSYNKVHSIWCSENKHLLTDILRNDWGYEGCMVSDWGAVRNECRAVMAGMDLQMPANGGIVAAIHNGLAQGQVTEEAINTAVKHVLHFVYRSTPERANPMTREVKHDIARRVATDGIVLLKNENNVLPLTKEKYKKIAVIGEYAENPLITGQGSAEVYTDKRYLETPLEELKKAFGEDVEIKYKEIYSRRSFPANMIWTAYDEWLRFVDGCDAVLFFAGSMESEDTEQFDRRTLELNPNVEFVINAITRVNKNVVVVLQSGSALILGDFRKKVAGILQTYLGGEGAGGAVADVLTGKVNPSGKLPETFPTVMRTDMEYPGDGLKVVYNEGFDVGYRYYDKHPQEICYPFGYGLSYTNFDYSDMCAALDGNTIRVSLSVANTGDFDGAQVLQLYTAKDQSCVTRSPKELKAFEKVFVKKGETVKVDLEIPVSDIAYFNVMLNEWIVEPGAYRVMLGASSRDIFFEKEILVDGNAPYTINHFATAMVG